MVELTKEEKEELWNRHVAGDESALHELYEAYLPLIRLIATKIHSRLPSSVELDDLVSEGFLGLVDAISKFDPSRGHQLETYASSRIRGKILDYLRDNDWVSRHSRRKFKLVADTQAALLQELQREPSNQEIADRIGWPLDKLEAVQARFMNSFILNIDERMKDSTHEFFSLSEILPDETLGDMDFHFEFEDISDKIADALNQLKPRESIVVYLRHYKDLTFEEIANLLGVNKSRASQIYDKAIATLREYMVA